MALSTRDQNTDTQDAEKLREQAQEMGKELLAKHGTNMPPDDTSSLSLSESLDKLENDLKEIRVEVLNKIGELDNLLLKAQQIVNDIREASHKA